VVGDGCGLFQAVVEADLEGVVAKRLTGAYNPKLARWHKILNRAYSQRCGRRRMVPRSRSGAPCRATNVGNDQVVRRLTAERHWTKGQVAVYRKGNFHHGDVAVASLPRSGIAQAARMLQSFDIADQAIQQPSY
jgi:hypothetical protein